MPTVNVAASLVADSSVTAGLTAAYKVASAIGANSSVAAALIDLDSSASILAGSLFTIDPTGITITHSPGPAIPPGFRVRTAQIPVTAPAAPPSSFTLSPSSAQTRASISARTQAGGAIRLSPPVIVKPPK